MIQTLHDTETDITAKMDGACYQVATTDCVVGGVGDEFTLNYSSTSRAVSFDGGSEAIIGGAFFKVMSDTTITLTANSTIYLCANINTGNPTGSTGSFVQRTSSNMKFENINGSGTQRDLLLYIITTNASGVTNVIDRRKIKTSSNGVLYGTSEPTSDIGNDGDIYIVYD